MKGSLLSFFFSFFFLALFGVLAGFAFPRDGFSQDLTVPDDFSVSLISEPALFRNPLDAESVTIKANGTAFLSASWGNEGPLSEVEIRLADGAVEAIYQAIEAENFFELTAFYSDPNILDGDFATITVTVGGRTHEVTARNIKVLAFDRISQTINSYLPDERVVLYNAINGADYEEIER